MRLTGPLCPAWWPATAARTVGRVIPLRRVLPVLALAGTLAACTAAPAPGPSPTDPTPSDPTTSASPAPAPTEPTGSPAPSPSCVDTTYAALSLPQRAGQLVMVALDAGHPAASLRPVIADQHVGNVLYLGGWTSGRADVTATSGLLQQMATPEATGGIGLLIAADQEGGVVQQLGGDFTTIPSARTQGTWDPDQLRHRATSWATELRSAGVNLNLAPVADTVPAQLGRANGPIGRWDRQFGDTPEAVSRSAVAVIEGMTAAGVQTSVKHFPGIGRIRGNTDHVATGLDDPDMSADDPYLQPFVAGWEAGAGLVMMSSATYPRLDPDNPAMFSPAILEGLLRERLGFDGVVITDDINAIAVRAVPVADRATRFLAAGGDILLTGDTPSAPRILAALTSAVETDPALAARVEAAVKRVLTLKAAMGLVPGCPS